MKRENMRRENALEAVRHLSRARVAQSLAALNLAVAHLIEKEQDAQTLNDLQTAFWMIEHAANLLDPIAKAN